MRLIFFPYFTSIYKCLPHAIYCNYWSLNQEKLSEPEQGADDPSADRKEQGPVDENSRMNLDSDAEAAKMDQGHMDV